MKDTVLMSEDELIEKAVGILMSGLGPVETSRFLALPAGKRIESVKRHRAWQSKLEKDEFFDTLFPTE